MIAIILGATVVVQWAIIGGLVRQLRRKPVTISMKEISERAAELSLQTGISFGDALRHLTGLLNYGGRFTK